MPLNPSRPSSSELVELHVFYVPEGSWNYRLNTISVEVVHKFISAGFIRVSPHLTLQALRQRLGEFLGEDAVSEKFLFLKCIGNNLAVVKTKQESELKLKSFAPPHALQPELYLLPIMDHLGNVYSMSSAVSPDGWQVTSGLAEASGTLQRSLSITLPKEEAKADIGILEHTLKEFLNKNQDEGDFHWTGRGKVTTIVPFRDQATQHPGASVGKKVTSKESPTGKRERGSSELHRSLEDSKINHFSNKKSSFWKNEDVRASVTGRTNSQVSKKEHISLPDLECHPPTCHPVLSPGTNNTSLLQMEKKELIEQMAQVKEERQYLERIREELIKDVEKLFEQNRSKQCPVSDGWKKKFFETKKVTASLEEVLTKLREDLELYYKKLLMQLEAREIKMRPKNLANISDSKNYLIIQITEVQHAIEQLKRKLDNDKMKLLIEVKMRKQAFSELRTLKSELTQKKVSTPGPAQLHMCTSFTS